MEEASFNDTIGEIEEVVDLSYPNDRRVISVYSINMYVVIDEYHRGNLMELVKVNTKYKTVDRKIKPVAVPLSRCCARARRRGRTTGVLD
jgi:hypothetical protein